MPRGPRSSSRVPGSSASDSSVSAPSASPLGVALDRVGDRWVLFVVDALADNPLRFGELVERVGAASNILTDRLRRLEADGIVVANAYSDRPLRFSYALTAAGQELANALIPLARWGAAADGRSAARFHRTCGTGIELRPWCPTCDRAVGPEEAGTAHQL